MQTLTINQQNYNMACGLSAATDAMQRLMNANVPVSEVRIINGRSYMKTGAITQSIEGLTPLSSFENRHSKRIRALLLGCVIEWIEYKQERAA